MGPVQIQHKQTRTVPISPILEHGGADWRDWAGGGGGEKLKAGIRD